MPVKLNFGGGLVSSLTSPPSQPDPYPPEALIAEKVQYGDREIIVTVPFPDTIVLHTYVMNHHLSQPIETGGKAADVAAQIDEEMHEVLKGYKSYESYSPIVASKVTMGKKAEAVFRLPYDDEQSLWFADLRIQRQQGKEDAYGRWSVRLEFSVSKAGPAGLVKLISMLDDTLTLQIPLLGTMRVRRVDPAVDLIGAEPIDLIARIPKPGKRRVYVGDNGRPETVYLYERKAALTKAPSKLSVKTTGPLRLKLYERRSYYEQLALDPVWGPSPHTRAEAERTWNKHEPKLVDLASLPNPFKGIHVAYAPAILADAPAPTRRDWLLYCLAALGGGASAAQAKSTLLKGSSFRSRHAKAAGDLINADRWARWADGLTYTGLDKWIEIAKANPAP